MGCGASSKARGHPDVQGKGQQLLEQTWIHGGAEGLATSGTTVEQITIEQPNALPLNTDADATTTQAGAAILIHSASGLRDEDWLLSGASDPYAVCRLGPIGPWLLKPAESERQSETVFGDVNPVWRLAFRSASPPEGSDSTWELQIRVYDKDLVSPDDFLGEVSIPFQTLVAAQNELKPYQLSGGGVVNVMYGSRVLEALNEELRETSEAQSNNRGWLSTVLRAAKKLGQFFNDALGSPHYWANLVKMGRVWSATVRNDGDASVDWFRRRSTNQKTGIDTYQWDGPELQNSTMHLGHSESWKILEELGARLGSNNSNGEASKPNFLGVQRLNGRFWPEVPWHGIGLSIPQETHAWIRPLLVKLAGPAGNWSPQWLTEKARFFFRGRESVIVPDDLRMWGTQILHQVFLGLELTEAEANEFMTMQTKVLIAIGAPEAALDAPGLSAIFDIDGLLKFKEKQLNLYRPALKKILPEETASLSDADLTALASSIMDALLFAGGQSVPTVMSYALEMPYSTYGQENLPAGFSLMNSSQLPSYIWEVIRRFPPVSGFVIEERSFATNADKRIYLNLQLAQQDARVWGGADATRFLMRPVSEYHAKFIGFAEPSIAPRLASPNAHSCPAKDLAFSMALCFTREFARTADAIEGGHMKLWIPRDVEDEKRPELKPDEIIFNLYGATRLVLSRDASVRGPMEAPVSNAWLLEGLSEQEKAALQGKVRRMNKMDEVNFSTRIWTDIVQQTVRPGNEKNAAQVGPPVQMSFSSSDFFNAPFGGLKFLTNDEDDQGFLSSIMDKLVAGGIQLLATSDVEDADRPVFYFDSPEEAAASQDAVFGKHLPPAFNEWEELRSDRGLRELCLFGVGSWYLSSVRSSDNVGHPVPSGALFECNLEYLSKYPTRSSWITYGHTVYFGEPEEGSELPGDLLGIWSCHHQELFTPSGRPQWEHVKAGFRSSLCTTLTLKDHLCHVHWIIANGLMTAARVTLSVDHPLRRLLKQFYFSTAAINVRSADILLPPGQLGHRTFAFTSDGWLSYFNDLCESWQWVPFPERLKRTGLPNSVLDVLPLNQDGMLLWKSFKNYVESFLSIFYSSDDEIRADAEIVAFWANFEQQFVSLWNLPELNFDNLVCFVADLAFWVTGGHEFVGSIVEYLTSLSGMHGKLVDGEAFPDVQTYVQSMIIISLTGVRQPALMDDWTHIFQVDSWSHSRRQKAIDVVREFRAELSRCSEEIQHQNFLRQHRGQKSFVAFDPRILETSVSI